MSRSRFRSPRARWRLLLLVVFVPAAAVGTTPAGAATPTALLPPAAAVDTLEGPDWLPFSGSATLWCSWGNPSPGNFCGSYHPLSSPALDISMPRGTSIYAAGPGVVVVAGNGCVELDYPCGGYAGNYVAIRHPNGIYSRYLHLGSSVVAVGSSVARGQRIGYSGATGSVCQGSAPCPHLHYDEIDNWSTVHRVDPGVMYAHRGTDVVALPGALGYGAWNQTPYNTVLRNDGYDLPPAPAAGFHPVPPTRLLDSRTATGGWNGSLRAGQPRELQIGGNGAVPASASAVVLNVTATNPTRPSYLTVYPSGVPIPVASNLNFLPGQTIPNLVTVRLANGGRAAFANGAGDVDVVADVVGWYDDGTGSADLFTALAPERVLDSRTSTGGWSGPLTGDGTRSLVVRNTHGVPASATAVVLNVTVTEPSATGWLRVFPSATTPPGTSSLNFTKGQRIANLVVAPIGADGRIAFAMSGGTVHVVADVAGYFAPTTGAGRLHAVSPTRVLDNRIGLGVAGSWAPGTARSVAVAGQQGIPAGVTAVVVNVTATNGTEGSYLTVYPTAGARPLASNLGFAPSQTIPNLVMAPVAADGTVQIYNEAGTVDVVADVVGFFTTT